MACRGRWVGWHAGDSQRRGEPGDGALYGPPQSPPAAPRLGHLPSRLGAPRRPVPGFLSPACLESLSPASSGVLVGPPSRSRPLVQQASPRPGAGLAGRV